MEERIATRHPQGKSGVNISKAKYDLIRDEIVHHLGINGEMTFTDLTEAVEGGLAGRFDGSIPWYVTTVKLDLEARGVIGRILKTTPQRLRLL